MAWITALTCVIGLVFFWGCSNKAPEFSSGKAITTVDVQVEEADAKPEEEVEHPTENMNEEDLSNIFDALANGEDPVLPAGWNTNPSGVSGAGAGAGDDDDDAAGAGDGSGDDDDGAGAGDDGQGFEDGGGSGAGDGSGADDGSGGADAGGAGTGTVVPELPDNLEVPNESELKVCAYLTGADIEDVVIGGASGAPIQSYSVIAMKLVGDGSSVELNLVGANAILQGVCLFLGGNEATATMTVGLKIENFIYSARGNSSVGTINFIDGGSMTQAAVDLRGNGAQLNINGSAGKIDCTKVVTVGGSSAGVSCN